MKLKYFLINIKSGIRYFWHVFCSKIGMDIQIKSNKTVEEICKEIVEYIESEDRNYVPSCEEFFLKYDYGIFDNMTNLISPEVQNALSKIKNQEIAMLKNLVIHLEPQYTDSKGIVHKLDKKEISKRFDKIMK